MIALEFDAPIDRGPGLRCRRRCERSVAIEEPERDRLFFDDHRAIRNACGNVSEAAVGESAIADPDGAFEHEHLHITGVIARRRVPPAGRQAGDQRNRARFAVATEQLDFDATRNSFGIEWPPSQIALVEETDILAPISVPGRRDRRILSRSRLQRRRDGEQDKQNSQQLHGGDLGGVNAKVRTISVFTGTPFSIAGLKTHCRAASTAASRSRGWLLIALASITRPSSEMVTCTSTDPEAFTLLAFAGYRGCTLVIASPHDTTPDGFGAPFEAAGPGFSETS